MSHNGGEGEAQKEGSYSWTGGAGEFTGEDIREILYGVVDMLNVIKDAMAEIVEKAIELMDGEKVGSDVASFYKSLKEAGLPEDMILEMTKEYFKKRLMAVDIINLISEVFGEGSMPTPRTAEYRWADDE